MTNKKPLNYFYPVSIVFGFLLVGIVSFFNPAFLPILSSITFVAVVVSAIRMGQLVAGTAYFGRLLDIIKGIRPPRDEDGKRKFSEYYKRYKLMMQKNRGEFLGIIIGLALSIALVAALLPLTPIGAVALLTLIPATIGRLSGLFNRIGRLRDIAGNVKEGKSLWRKKRINYFLAVSLGLLIGIGLIAAMLLLVNPAAIIAVAAASVGVAASAAAVTFAGVAAILAYTVVGLFVLSALVSLCSYVGRWFDLVLGKRTIVGFTRDLIFGASEKQSKISDRINKNKFESLFTLVGVPLSIVAGVVTATLLTTGLITVVGGPLAFVGFPAALAFLVVATVVAGAGMGLIWRMGYSLDQSAKLPKYVSEQDQQLKPTPYMEKSQIEDELKSYTKKSGILGLLTLHAGHQYVEHVEWLLDQNRDGLGLYRGLRDLRKNSKRWNEGGDLAKIIRKIEEANPEFKATIDRDREHAHKPLDGNKIRVMLETYTKYSGIYGFFNGHANHHHAKRVTQLLQDPNSANYNSASFFNELESIRYKAVADKRWNPDGELAHIINEIEVSTYVM